MTDRERRLLREDVTTRRMRYTGAPDLPMQVAVVLDGEAGRGLHNPEICAVAQAWRMLDERIVPLRIGDREVKATMLRLFMDVSEGAGEKVVRRRAIHLFWYQGARGATAANHSRHIVRSYWDAGFAHVRHRWALMSFAVYLRESDSGGLDDDMERRALAELEALIAAVSPHILSHPCEEEDGFH